VTPTAPSGSPRRAALWLFVLYVSVYIVPLAFRPLSSPDEVRYGAISHEMIASGDWVSPRFNGVRYFEKPILGYWLNSAAMSALGENAFALRLPTALAAGLTALIVYLLTARFAARTTALLAAGIYLSTFLVSGVGTTAVFDTFLTLFLTAALAAYFAALSAPAGRARLGYLAICGAACAGAFLTKGFLALAIPVLVAAPFLAVERRWRELVTTSWLPILSATALIAPWALAIHRHEPDFWHYFFWIEHIQRFFSDNAQHTQPFWYFFVYAPLIGLPWIFTLPAAVEGLRKPRADRAFLVYLACWFALPWLFFSVSRGKLLTYVLPCFPPLSMLLAVGLEGYGRLAARRSWQIGAGLVALILLSALAALAAAQWGAFGSAPYAPSERAKLLFVVLCLLAGTGAAIVAASRPRASVRFAALGGAGIALFLVLAVGLPQMALDNFAPRALLTDGALAAPDALIVADASSFGAVAWYAKRDDIYLMTPGEIAYGLGYAESRVRNLQDGGLARLIEDNRGVRDVFVVCRPENEPQIGMNLPDGATRVERGGLVRWHIPMQELARGG